MEEIENEHEYHFEEGDVPIRTIELPNGCTLIVQAQSKGPRIICYTKGLSIGAQILEENPFEYGSDAWANEEIRMYEEALEIDLKVHTDFIKQCLTKL